MSEITIRQSCAEDVSVLAQLEKICFSDPIEEDMLLRIVKAENQHAFTALCDGEPAGYITVQHVLDEGYINNVAVFPQYRRMGIGDRLLQELSSWAEERGLAFLTLEVRESNVPAISLYEKNGFESVGLRKNYYEKPKENAILMTKHFMSEALT